MITGCGGRSGSRESTFRAFGYHGEKRAGIRDPKFWSLDPAVQEELAGTTWETMRRIYDYVDVATMKDAVAALEADTAAAPPQTRRRGGLKKAA